MPASSPTASAIAAVGLGAGVLDASGRRLLHLHPRPSGFLRDRERRRQGRGPHVAPARLWRPRRLPRARTCTGLQIRPSDGQALLQHRRPRPQRPTRSNGREVAWPDTGAVLRCKPDGTELELFATGLRNPQELALRRIRQPLHGRQQTPTAATRPGWSTSPRGATAAGGSATSSSRSRPPGARGNDEKLWHLPWGRPGRLPPPPAGAPLRRPVGPGLRSRRHASCPTAIAATSSLCDFRGAPGQSGVRTFAVRPQGRLPSRWSSADQFLWGLEATDGRLRARRRALRLDWVEGWRYDHEGADRQGLSTRRGPTTPGCAR